MKTRNCNLLTVSLFTLVCVFLLSGGAAIAGVSKGDYAGVSMSEIIVFLEKQGYDVREIEKDGDHYEIEATLNGASFEIDVDSKEGKIVEIEADDD